jgi:hypothetical protein
MPKIWHNGRNDLSHLVAPVQPFNEFIETYANYLVDKVGGTKEAWTEIMSLNTAEVRKVLYLSMVTPHGSNKPRQMPQEISKFLSTLLNTLKPEYRENTAELTFALKERPFYCSALEKQVELVLWGVVAARNDWM